jgi:predicted glycoside hydrolase/deacetylase ChbG (UPF0249 family)
MTASPNPLLKRLGLAENDRAIIIHADDIGMCQASVEAFSDLSQAGIVSSGAVMVPCPWFPYAAAYARDHVEADLGIHLTLTSEWKTYRWSPVSTCDPASGLVDADGFFFRTSAEVQQRGDPAAVERELESQVLRALQLGIVPTHLDAHMGSVAHPKFIGIYAKLAAKFRLPAMMLRLDEAGWRAVGLEAEAARSAEALAGQLEGSGAPLLDAMASMPLDSHEDRLERAKHLLSGLKPGVTHFVLHPAKDTPELRAIASDWRSRAADYQAFMDEGLRKHIQQIGLRVLGYGALKDLVRGM